MVVEKNLSNRLVYFELLPEQALSLGMTGLSRTLFKKPQNNSLNRHNEIFMHLT